MLDNLRDQPDTPFFKEEEPTPEESEQKTGKGRRRKAGKTTGMTAFQRFMLSVIFFITICLLGFMVLIFTGKIVPSFLY